MASPTVDHQRQWVARLTSCHYRPLWFDKAEGDYGPVGKMINELLKLRNAHADAGECDGLSHDDICSVLNDVNNVADEARADEKHFKMLNLIDNTLVGFLEKGKGGVRKKWDRLARQMLTLILRGETAVQDQAISQATVVKK